MAPKIGASQNIQSCSSGSPIAINAWDVDLAGFTDVLVIGILIK